MPKIVPIVEGPGEVEAVPVLLNKVLTDLSRNEILVAQPKNAHGVGNLTGQGGLERFLRYAFNEPDAAAVLVIRDADTGCPVTMARDLADRARSLKPPIPVAIVVAKCEFEAWFLASLPTIAGRSVLGRPGIIAGTTCDDPEAIGDVKGWIGRHMPGSRTYKETFDQSPMAAMIDTGIAQYNSRSFRRLWKAVRELVDAHDRSETGVTPYFGE